MKRAWCAVFHWTHLRDRKGNSWCQKCGLVWSTVDRVQP